MIKIPLRDGPGEAISPDYCYPSPITSSGNQKIFLVTDCFSRHAVMHPVATLEFSALGNAKVVINDYIDPEKYIKRSRG